ncbi:MAG: hypothetical protein QOJ09_1471 [Actinomycetota bacterium]|nr:hypothetical protein [Actinomycetota bacterium]
MRLRAASGVVALSIALCPSIAAAADGPEIKHNKCRDGIEYGGNVPGSQGQGAPQGNGSGKGSGKSSGSSQPVFRGRYPILSADASGGTCVDTATRTFPSQAEATSFELAQEQRWRTLVAQYPLCPNAVVPQQNPAVLAEVFWGEVLLPHPAPEIAPGWALTGKLSFLETRAPTTQSFTRDTPLGPLTITAAGEFLVDWGDGTSTGPHPYAGAPWPDGRITHGYSTKGTVNVVVTERWRATWQLAGQSGTLTALSTQGRLDGFAVREVQSVRNR